MIVLLQIEGGRIFGNAFLVLAHGHCIAGLSLKPSFFRFFGGEMITELTSCIGSFSTGFFRQIAKVFGCVVLILCSFVLAGCKDSFSANKSVTNTSQANLSHSGQGGASPGGSSATTDLKTCIFNGYEMQNGSSMMAFERSMVTGPEICKSEKRICMNGVLQGSFSFSTCQVVTTSSPIGTSTAKNCFFPDGTVVNHGTSRIAYAAPTVPAGQSCAVASEIRTCNDGFLSGRYSALSCVVESPSPTTPTGPSSSDIQWPPARAAVPLNHTVLIDDATNANLIDGRRNPRYFTMTSVHGFDLSADGQGVLLESAYLTGEPRFSIFGDVFFKDLSSGMMKNLSQLPSGASLAGHSWVRLARSLTQNSSGFIFTSDSKLTSDDINGSNDLFYFDRASSKSYLVSANRDGVQARGFVGPGLISADGRYVAFMAADQSWFPNIETRRYDSNVFLKDLRSGDLFPVSVAPSKNAFLYDTNLLSMSFDGELIVFAARSSESAPARQVFGWRRSTRQTFVLVKEVAGVSHLTTLMSQDGARLAFEMQGRVFVQETSSNAVPLEVTCNETGVCANSRAKLLSISGDGLSVLFLSRASNFDTAGSTNGLADLFVKDLRTGRVKRVLPNGVSVDSGCVIDDQLIEARLSYDGSVLAFTSTANILGDLPPVLANNCQSAPRHLYVTPTQRQ